jgi:hypothetical protein
VVWIDAPESAHHVSVFDVGDDMLVCCSATGQFLVDARRATVTAWHANGSIDAWEHRLVATALPLMLAERGDLVLHASGVVAGNGCGVVFCGPPGRGKSTIAAALADAGHAVIGEDGMVVTFEPGRPPLAWPGPAGIRLSHSLDGPKRTEQVPVALETTQPVPLAAVVLLDPRSDHGLACERVPATTALALLTPHAMHAGADRLPSAYSQLARLAAAVPVLRASMPDDLTAAPAAAQSLLDHACTA